MGNTSQGHCEYETVYLAPPKMRVKGAHHALDCDEE